jgi:hypothetical protein
MTKIPLQAVTVTYTQSLTITPTNEMFENWDVEPTQTAFEGYALVLLELGECTYNTTTTRLTTVEINWEDTN